MTQSHTSVSKPSLLLTLVCLAIVRRHRPEWTAITLQEAITADKHLSAARLSRLTTRAIAGFEAVVAALTRIGRPPVQTERNASAEPSGLLAALLEVTTALLGRLQLRRQAARDLVVGAWLRLRAAHPELTQKRFCQTLAISPRTLRSWLTLPTACAPVELRVQPSPAPSPKTRPPRRPRFGFDVTLPDTQLAADTTDLSAFSVPLKLIAAQDVGGRDVDLLDAVIVDDHECSAHVVDVLTAALDGQSGVQVITDQGTPYLAGATQDALEALQADHAPQREADPLGKATIERAFGTIKRIAGPLLSLTDRLASALPQLARVELAKPITTLLLTALLRAYQAGARAAVRADTARAGIDPETLSRLAAQSRDQARAEDRSIRLLLTRVHRLYQLRGPLNPSIRALRSFGIEALQRAERAFALNAHRDDIRDRTAYFSAIVRRCHDDLQRERIRRRLDRETLDMLEQDQQRCLARHAAWNHDPARWLADALDALAAQWQPHTQSLLCGGVGLGRTWLRAAIARLCELHTDLAAADTAATVFADFERRWIDRLGQLGLDAVAAILRDHLPPTPSADRTADCAQRFAAAILPSTGPPSRSDPPFGLRT